ncbi:hypothetical protein [Vibrio spartinae]|uniref:hypothetical protein n=1 Tax=Vibrio spartinae TaxID=1918945 RepID=UPI001967BC7C|nr:hypothetical protein [Vibrio spartinae]
MDKPSALNPLPSSEMNNTAPTLPAGEATEGLSPDRAAKALMAAGYLIPDGNRPQRKVSLPDNTRPRMYCVKGCILDD